MCVYNCTRRACSGECRAILIKTSAHTHKHTYKTHTHIQPHSRIVCVHDYIDSSISCAANNLSAAYLDAHIAMRVHLCVTRWPCDCVWHTQTQRATLSLAVPTERKTRACAAPFFLSILWSQALSSILTMFAWLFIECLRYLYHSYFQGLHLTAYNDLISSSIISLLLNASS